MKWIWTRLRSINTISYFVLTVSCLLVFTSIELVGQKNVPTVWSGQVHIGKILPHTDNFPMGINGWTRTFHLEYIQVRSGANQWHKDWRYPEVGARMDLTDFGEGAFLGRSVGVLPFIRWSSRSYEHWDWYIDIGGGLAYMDRPYDVLTNPDNNVIGTHWNNITQLCGGLRWSIAPQSELSLGLVLAHFSNGKIKSPNLGINTVSLAAGYRFLIGQSMSRPPQTNTIQNNYWGVAYHVGLGIHDGGLGTPIHPVWIHSLSVTRQTSNIHRIWSGITYAADRYKYQILSLQLPFDPKSIQFQSSDISIWLGTEWIAGNVSIWLQSGYYLYHPFLKPSPIYFKFGTHYYPFKKEFLKGLFCGVNIKSHYGIADYFEFRLGYLHTFEGNR